MCDVDLANNENDEEFSTFRTEADNIVISIQQENRVAGIGRLPSVEPIWHVPFE